MASNYDILGGAEPRDMYLVIRVKNVADLVRKEGGTPGALAYSLAPDAITQKVYNEMRAEMIKEFAQKGVAVDLEVTSTPPGSMAPLRAEFLRGAAVGVAGVGAGWALWRFVLSRFFG